MCKYHVISRVWLNLDVSLSAFKSTILRYWVLNFVEREISRKGICWNIKFDFCDFELLFYRLKRLIWNGWFRMIERFFSKETKSPRKIGRNRWFLPFSRLANDQNIEEIMFTLSLFSHIFYRELEIFERMKWKKFNSKWFNSIRFDFLILIIFEK